VHRVAFVLTAIAVAACAPQPVEAPPRPSGDTATQSVGQVVHATGAFSITLPQGVRQVRVQGIDSAVDQFEGPNYTIMTDYGMYSCGADSSEAGASVETATIDGRSASVVRYRGGDNAARSVQLTARFTGLGANAQQPLCLAAHAQCADDAACDAARGVINSIDFD
jgi:hypothetical protein